MEESRFDRFFSSPMFIPSLRSAQSPIRLRMSGDVSSLPHSPSCHSRGQIYCILLSVALVRERTIPTERPPPVGEVSANFCG